MEEDNAIKESNNGSYLTGIIGGIIGGAIGAIPWVLMYVYGNRIVAILSILIGYTTFKGYKICKGKITKALPMIIGIITLVIISIVTLVICPAILLQKEGIEISVDVFERIYNDAEIKAAIVRDLAVSIIFAFAGIVGVMKSIRLQLESGVNANEVAFDTKILTQDNIKIKAIFEGFDAIGKEHTVAKEDIIGEIKKEFEIDEDAAIRKLKTAVALKNVKEKQGEYYYVKPSIGKTLLITWGCICLIAIISMVIALVICKDDKNSSTGTNKSKSNSSGYQRSSSGKETFEIEYTGIVLYINSNQVAYNNDEMRRKIGEEAADKYLFAVGDTKKEIAAYGFLFPSDGDLESWAEEDRENSYNYNKSVGALKSKRINNIDFKTYTYGATNDNENRGKVYLCEVDGYFLMLEVGSKKSGETAMDNFIGEIFTK